MRGRWLDYDRFAVWGLGRSGLAVSELLASRGKHVLATDPGKPSRPGELPDGVEFAPGDNSLGDAEVLVVSPGLNPSNPVFERVPEDIPVVSEIEIAWAATDTPFIGITGTDGKTTTTELTAHFLSSAGIDTVAAGNIGVPLSEVVADSNDYEVIVAEVSAFQLWTTHDFDVAAGIFTNLASDHLDYFDSWEAYVAAKRRMIANCDDQMIAFNWDDSILRGWANEYSGPYVATSTKLEPDAPDAAERWWYDERSRSVFLDTQRPYFDTRDYRVTGFYGDHNWANFMGAASIAHFAFGVSNAEIADALRSFRVGAHRVEPCGEVDGVAFYDDSKATNANASMAGIRALPSIRPPREDLVVVAGGVDKGIDLEELAALLTKRARAVILIGEISERYAAALADAGFPVDSVQCSDSMTDAVDRAFRAARPGAAVLLSPACSSFDMFDSYADRGEQFQAAVRAITPAR